MKKTLLPIGLIFTLAILWSCSKDQAATSELVGTWRLVEFANKDSASGEWVHVYGRHPKGYFTYSNKGILNINISSEVPLEVTESIADTLKVSWKDLVFSKAMGYFGTYSIKADSGIVIHHVEGGSIPWYIGSDQPRPFQLRGDTLVIGDNTTWKRILVRADD